jgi:DNA uptake protein ComE-like DNA-binding protein
MPRYSDLPTQAVAWRMKKSLTPEHKSLLFVGCIALLGSAVRVVRAYAPDSVAESVPALAGLRPGTPQPDLDRQIAAAGSAAGAADTARSGKAKRKGPPRRRASAIIRDTAIRPPGRVIQPTPAQPGRGADDMSHVGGRLDVDAASAAQLDSLPGIGPALANRIVLDRAAHGPFGAMSGLMRVPGVGAATARRLDSLVTFSGTERPVSAAAESTLVRRRRRQRPPPEKPALS